MRNGHTRRSRPGATNWVRSLFTLLFLELARIAPGRCCECKSDDHGPPTLSYTSWEAIGNCNAVDESTIHCAANDMDLDYWPYILQPHPIDFVHHPVGVVTSDKYLTLNCSISSALVNCSDLFQPNFHWELNGTAIYSSSVFMVEQNTTSSLLTVYMHSESNTEGVYTCFVEDHYFSLQSLPAQVQKPGSLSWTKEVYDDPQMMTPIDDNTYIMSVQEGGTAVLECTGTGFTGHQIVNWFDESGYLSADVCQCYLPNENLFIQNFSLPSSTSSTVDRVQYTCVVNDGTFSTKKTYLLYIKYTSPHDPLYPTFVASPRSQEIAVGEDLILYCIANGQLPISYSWSKNGVPLVSEGFDNTGVLIVQNSSLEDSGDYTCTASNRINRIFFTAHVVVIGLPEVSIVPDPTLYLSLDGDILLPSANTSYSVSLKCLVSSNSSSLQLTWLFRGQPIPTTEQYFVSGNQLKITSSDISDVTGSVQCLAEDIGGGGSDTIRIVQQDKPNPPRQINVTTHSSTNYTYLIEWNPPVMSDNLAMADISYQVNITYLLPGLPQCYSTVYVFPFVKETSVILDAKNSHGLLDCMICPGDYECGNEQISEISVDVAAFYVETPHTTSDSTSSYFSVNEGLESTLTLTDMKETFTLVSSMNPHYNVTLSWLSLGESYLADSAHCGLDILYYQNYFVCWSCAGVDLMINNSCLSYQKEHMDATGYCPPTSYNVSVNCVTSCQWKVGIAPLNFQFGLDDFCSTTIHWTDTMTFVTPAFVPVKGSLDSVSWANNGSSFILDVTLPPDNMTCDPANITVTYHYKNYFSMSTSFDAALKSQMIDVDSCYVPYTVSFVYNNSAGNSDPSNSWQLPSPNATKAAVLSGFIIQRDSKSPTNLTLTWNSSQASNCLYSNPFFTAKINLSWVGTNHSSCAAASFNGSIDVTKYQNHSLALLDKEYYVAYCVLVMYQLSLTYESSDSYYNTSAYVSVTSLMPPTSSSHNGDTSTINFGTPDDTGVDTPANSSYAIPSLGVSVAVLLILFIVFILVICGLACKKCRKSHLHNDELEEVRRLVPEGAEERRNIMCKDLEVDDIRSEHTQYDRLTMDNFLSDVMSQRVGPYMADIAEELDVDDAGDKIPQQRWIRPVTPPTTERVLNNHASRHMDRSPHKLASCQQQSQACPTETCTEPSYIQPHLIDPLKSGHSYSQENLIELDDMILTQKDSSVQSSSLIHMREYVGRANALLSPSPSSNLTNLTAIQQQPSHQPSFTVNTCSLLGHHKMGGGLPYSHAQRASGIQSSHPCDNNQQDIALSQRPLSTVESRVSPSYSGHVTTPEHHFVSSYSRNITHDGYVDENMQMMHQSDQSTCRKPGMYRVGSPIGSVDPLQQDLSHSAVEPGISWNQQDHPSLPSKHPFQSRTVASDVPQPSLARPSSRLSSDSGMTVLSNSSSEQSVFTDVSEQQPLQAKSMRLSRRHSSGISSMPPSIPATPDTGQQSFQFFEKEVQLSHTGSRSSLMPTNTSRTRPTAVGSDYISNPSQPLFHAPRRVVQSMAGCQISHPCPYDPGNRPFHQASRQSSLPSANRLPPLSGVPTQIPDIAVQQKKFSGHQAGQYSSLSSKTGVHSSPNKAPVLSRTDRRRTSDYHPDTLDQCPSHTDCYSSMSHKRGHITLPRTNPSAPMLQIPSLLPYYSASSTCQTQCIGPAETDRNMLRSEWKQSSSTHKLRTLQPELVPEENLACSDESMQSRSSSISTESCSLGSLSASMEELSKLNNHNKPSPDQLVHTSNTDTGRVKAPLANYTNTNDIEIDDVVFNLQEAFPKMTSSPYQTW